MQYGFTEKNPNYLPISNIYAGRDCDIVCGLLWSSFREKKELKSVYLSWTLYFVEER